jgi:subtilisin family serine protease
LFLHNLKLKNRDRMMPMQRYVIANRRAGKFDAHAKILSRTMMARSLVGFAPQIVSDLNPVDPLARRVTIVEAEPAEMASRIATAPRDVIIEPEILHWRDIVPPVEFRSVRRGGAVPLDVGVSEAFAISVTGDGRPLPNAQIEFYAQGAGGIVRRDGQTDAAGRCNFQIPIGSTALAAAIVPAAGFWSMIVRGAALSSVIDCPPLPSNGPLGWWHDILGLDVFDAALGAGIKVGVADTGVGPHPSVGHVTLLGAFVDGELLPGAAAAADIEVHGTHVTGIIGARPTRANDYGGIAPGCDLAAGRIYRGAHDGATNADIANAIDALSRGHQVDIINLSLGATVASEIVHDAIVDAAERGTICICAAGNDASAVNYPAAFPEALAVGAVGMQGWGPPGSIASSRLPMQPNLFGTQNLFVANFCSNGNQVQCAGPGVGIISPVPNRVDTEILHAALDGTSMACPAVTAVLAVLLSRNAAYRALPRDHSRFHAARRILTDTLRDIGLPPTYAGRGIPALQVPVS